MGVITLQKDRQQWSCIHNNQQYKQEQRSMRRSSWRQISSLLLLLLLNLALRSQAWIHHLPAAQRSSSRLFSSLQTNGSQQTRPAPPREVNFDDDCDDDNDDSNQQAWIREGLNKLALGSSNEPAAMMMMGQQQATVGPTHVIVYDTTLRGMFVCSMYVR